LLSLHSLPSYVFELGQHRKSLLPWPVNQIKSNPLMVVPSCVSYGKSQFLYDGRCNLIIIIITLIMLSVLSLPASSFLFLFFFLSLTFNNESLPSLLLLLLA